MIRRALGAAAGLALAATLVLGAVAQAGTTKMVRDIDTTGGSSPSELTRYKGQLFFTARTPSKGRELWKSDGTRTGTKLVKDIDPGAANSGPRDLTVVDGKLFFVAHHPVRGFKLYVTDGTASGTRMLWRASADYSNPDGLTKVGKTLFFQAKHPRKGYELWKSDGTKAGTRLLKDIAKGVPDSDPGSFVRLGSWLFFVVEKDGRGQIWKTNGTRTFRVADRFAPGGIARPSQLTRVGQKLFFRAGDGTHGTELWMWKQ